MNREEFFHFVAGGTGGTVSAFVTCPLEVVKTRLQSSNSGFQRPESGSTRSAGPVTASTTGPSHGGVSPAAPTAAQGSRHHHYRPHPPTHHSHSISTTTTTTPGGGAHSGKEPVPLRYIKRTEGWTGLYRGLGPNLVGVIPARSIYFYSYNRAKRTVNGSMPKGYRDTPFVHLISAGVGGFCSATATNPLWLVKTRLQLDRSCGNNSLTFTRCTINIYNTLGVTASYWGISETMINFVIYEYLKKMWAEYQESHPELANHWFYSKVARTRLREDGHKYRSFWQTLRTVFHEEGRRGLYRGLVTQMVRQIPNTAVLMGTYELTVDLLGRYFSTKSEDNPQHEKTSAG
eukprot:TCALIF_12865-PA protein Name:"Similar to slc25a36a Solute carrier family 25 member 36-A (Danio rerio)" AED:0.19 eAED:0.19 QI:234/0.42/0.62/0.87/0.85/0.75/8/860/345